VNRNLKMGEVELIGFDMDYTLAIYHQAEMERLSIELTLKKLVENRGYSPRIMELGYQPEWAMRGLMVDTQLGNVFKMDRHAHVGRCFHGGRLLSREERTALYRQARLKPQPPRYAWIDTLFALPEAVMYTRLVDFYEKNQVNGRKLDYHRLWEDIRACIDEAHRDDSLKSIVRGDLARFIKVDPDLPATLHKLRSAGKRLFVLTNSLWDYTDAVMRFLLDEKLPAYPSWRHYFDIVVVGGAKPAFFTDQNPFVEIDPVTGKQGHNARGDLLRGHVYMGGNLGEFEEKAGSRGDRVLYVGDHIYGDILRAKKSSVWRTCMIIQELEDELAASERLGPKITLLDQLDRKRRNLDAEVDYQNLVLKSLQRMAEDGGGVLPSGAPFASLEEAKRATKEVLDHLRSALRETSEQLDRLDDEIDRGFNPFWGPIFKEGNENSRFGEQVEDYACLYTSRVSNFLAYSPLRYFRAPRDYMPHEM
jgi:HAD superfamily 5'-nucleotidase-like hydrolase